MKKIKLLEILMVVFMICSISGCSLGKSEYDIVGMEKYDTNEDCSVEDFPFQDSKNAKKMVKLYNKMMGDTDAEFYYVENDNDVFKQNLNGYGQLYYGELKDGRPTGNGILMTEWYLDYVGQDVAMVRGIEYIGGFEKGKKSGYGWNFEVFESMGISRLNYEGEFAKGRFREGTEYWIVNSESENDFSKTEYKVFGDEFIGEINLQRQKVVFKGNIKKGCMYEYDGEYIKTYEGEFFGDMPHGEGVEYYPSGEIKYEGKYKYGKYHGKGILYNEDGSVKYEGKFKNGEVA